jgi:hypothetical protein
MEFEPGSALWVGAVVLVHGMIISGWKAGSPFIRKAISSYWNGLRGRRRG